MRTTKIFCDICKEEKAGKEFIGYKTLKTKFEIRYKGFVFDSVAKDICHNCAGEIVKLFKNIN